MSGIALIWAANIKGLKPAAKIVLIQLADFHNKETGRCYPSARRLAEECEMDRATVFRHLKELEDRGLVTRHPRGNGEGGRSSNQYELHMEFKLGGSSKGGVESQNATGVESHGCDGGSGTGATGVVAKCDTNLTIKPGSKPSTPKPPRGASATNAKTLDENCIKILEAVCSPEVAADFVEHRRAMKRPMTEKAAKMIAKKVKGHPSPDAALCHSIESGWLSVFPEKVDARQASMFNSNAGPKVSEDIALKNIARSIEMGITATLTASKVRACIDAGLVSEAMCREKGLI